MGYTHYWEGKIDCSPARWQKIQEDVIRVKDAAGIPLGNWEGKYAPVFSDKEISLNGVDVQGHESFVLEYQGTGKFAFCKTAQKPYDIVVCAALIIAKEYCPDLKVSSDGGEADWKPAIDLCQKVLGYGTFPCEKEEADEEVK